MRRLIVVAAAVPLVFVARTTHAQFRDSQRARWSIEVSADAAFHTRSLAGADLRTGGGFGFNARYRLQPHLAAYAGWEWHMQQTKQLLEGQTLDLNDTGYALGLRFEHPLLSTIAGWARTGALINHIEVENEDGDTIDDTGHGLGWEGAAGLTFALSQRYGLTPGVRYRTLSRDITVDGVARSATLSYVTVGVGLSVAF